MFGGTEQSWTYSHVAAIGMLEVEYCRPVVRLVLFESAGGASGRLGVVLIRVHRYIESITVILRSLCQIAVGSQWCRKSTHAFYIKDGMLVHIFLQMQSDNRVIVRNHSLLQQSGEHGEKFVLE